MLWRSHGEVNKRKLTIYYIHIYINSLDFTNDPISLHNCIRNSYLLTRILTMYPNSIFVYSLSACALKLLTRPLLNMNLQTAKHLPIIGRKMKNAQLSQFWIKNYCTIELYVLKLPEI